MFVKEASKRIIVSILIFPPIALLIYAVFSYLIFFDFKNSIVKNFEKVEKRFYPLFNEERLKFKAEIIKELIDNEGFDNFISKNVKYLNEPLEAQIIIFKNKNLVYPKKIDKNLNKIINSFPENKVYQTKNFFLYSIKDKDKRIITYFNKSIFKSKDKKIKEEINSIAKNSFFKTLIFLVIIWFFIVAVSVILALWIYKVLTKYQESLEESNRKIIFQSRQALLGELLPMIAHQWRQPLNKIASIIMKMRWELSKGNMDINSIDRQAQSIENSVELMSNTIEDFRTFYRPKTQLEYTDLSVIIRKAIYFLDELLDKNKINITSYVSPISMKINANEFLQVVINLIKNAADAIDKNGHIEIYLKEREDDFVEFRIEDDGPGIPQDKLEKIFEAHESTKQGSMGLGLYMSKLIVESHFKGRIQAYNTSKGAGFIILIPKKD